MDSYVRNKTPRVVLLEENNRAQTSGMKPSRSDHPGVDYFALTARPGVIISLMAYHNHLPLIIISI